MSRSPRPSARSILLAVITILATPAFSGAVDPGAAIPTSSEASDQKSGALLLYSLFSSGKKHDTRISVTNSNEATAAVARLFFVDGTTGAANVKDLCLAPLHTASIKASQVSPGQTGYVVAVAIDFTTGVPLDFNFLSGQAAVVLPSKYRATIPAMALAKLTATNVTSTDGTLAALFFDGLALSGSYNKTPRVLQVSDVPSAQDRTATLIVVNRIGGNLSTTAATLGNFGGNVLNDLGASAAIGTALGSRQLVQELNDGFPAVPNLSTMIPAGHTGWMKLFSPSDIGVFGAVLYGQSGKPGKKIKDRKVSRPDGGMNMRTLTTTSAANFVIPVRPAICN
jgi:hypothetical protein